jgi:hypothetical protein
MVGLHELRFCVEVDKDGLTRLHKLGSSSNGLNARASLGAHPDLTSLVDT